jgi:fatty acid desaturase
MWTFGIFVGTVLPTWPGRLAGWAIILAALVRMHYLFHEAAHRSLFKHRWVNDLFGSALGSLAFVPHAAYRAHHLEHHALTRVDLDGRQDSEGFYDEVADRLGYLTTILFGGGYLSLWYTWQIARCVARRPPLWLRSRGSARNLQTWGITSILGSVALVIILINVGLAPEMVTWWLIPIAVFLSTLFTMLGFYEHHDVERNKPIIFASATIQSNAIYRWLTLNALCHRAHHLLPNAAFHRLPMVEHQIRLTLQRQYTEDTAPHHSGILRFHLNLWRNLPWRMHN